MSIIAGVFFLYIYPHIKETSFLKNKDTPKNKQISHVLIKETLYNSSPIFTFRIYENNDDWYNDNLWTPLNKCRCIAHYSPSADINRVRFACVNKINDMISVYLDKRFNTSFDAGMKALFCFNNTTRIWLE